MKTIYQAVSAKLQYPKCTDFDEFVLLDTFSKEEARDACVSDWQHLSDRDKERTRNFIRVWESPDDIADIKDFTYDLDEKFEIVDEIPW